MGAYAGFKHHDNKSPTKPNQGLKKDAARAGKDRDSLQA